MAGICTASTRDSGGSCEHLTLTVSLDGDSFTFKAGHHDPAPLTSDEKLDLLRKLARWHKSKGADLAAFLGRVLLGEEATNVQQQDLLTRDVTKTNIGTAYVNVPPGANGERVLIDFTGCTQYRLRLWANFAGTGPWQVRIVRDSDNAVLYESPSLTQSGERELDSGWQNLPAAASGAIEVRLQAKSTTAADDPIFHRCTLGKK